METDVLMTASEVCAALRMTPQNWNKYRRDAESVGHQFKGRKGGAIAYSESDRQIVLSFKDGNPIYPDGQPTNAKSTMDFSHVDHTAIEDRAYNAGAGLARQVGGQIQAYEQARDQVVEQVAGYVANRNASIVTDALALAAQMTEGYEFPVGLDSMMQPLTRVAKSAKAPTALPGNLFPQPSQLPPAK